MSRLMVVMLSSIVLLVPGATEAESLQCRSEEVPVERLIANLQQQTEKTPSSWQSYLNLGRAYAIAYARKMPTLEACGTTAVLTSRADTGEENRQPDVIPDAGGRFTEAARYRDGALAAYARAVSLAPNQAIARLGYAWILQQSGRLVEAVTQYREAVALAWPVDREANERKVNPDGSLVFTLGPTPGTLFLTEEAVRHLIPLLDSTKDATEIATLRERVAFIAKGPRSISPIVIPLRRNAALTELVDDRAHVTFDLDGFGARAWTWVTPDAGWIVFDPDGAGRITSGLQLFGNMTFWLFWENGYEALRALDDNVDGWLRDGELAGLAIWRDANGDGVSQPDEVRPLSEWGIGELSVSYESDAEDPDVLASSPAGVRFTDGSVRPTFDVMLHAR